MKAPPWRYRLLLAAAALLFSTGGAAIKAVSLAPWQVASFRSGIAAMALLATIPQARSGWSWRIVPVAAAYAVTLLLFVIANRMTTAANAIFLQSTAPLYVLLLGPMFLHERIRRTDLLYMTAVLAGIALFVAGSQAPLVTAPDPRGGNIVALASGVTYALMLTGLRWLERYGRATAGLAATALGNLLAFLAALPLALPWRGAGAADITVLLYLGVVQIGLAYFCLTHAIRHIPAIEATTLLMIEPALSPVWSWLAHGERPGVLPLTGGAVILAASLVNAWRRAPDAAAAASPPPLE